MNSKLASKQGMWWLPHVPTVRVSGNLVIDAGHRSTLNLSGKFPELPPTQYSVILGQTVDGIRVSLHRARQVGGSMWTRSGQEYSVFEGLESYVGAWFESPKAVRFTGFGAVVQGLVDWLRGYDHITQDWSGDEQTVILRNSSTVNSDCSAAIDGITFRALSSSPRMSSSSNREIVFRQVAAVKMSSDASVPITSYLKLLHDFQSFLWLVFQRPAAIEELIGECDAKEALRAESDLPASDVRIYWNGLTREANAPSAYSSALLHAEDVAEIFSDVFAKWVALRDEMPAVHQLFFLPQYGNRLYTESRFLGLAQACEAYARTRLGTEYMSQEEWLSDPYERLADGIPASLSAGHKSSLRARLRYAHLFSFRKMMTVLVDQTPYVRDRLLRCPSVFANDVATLRNYHVHLAADLQRQVLEAPPIDHMIDYLEVLLHTRLLMDIGLGKPAVLETLMGAPFFDTKFRLRHYPSPHARFYVRTGPS